MEIGPLNGAQVLVLARAGVIVPFIEEKVRNVNGIPVASYGADVGGYDVRLGTRFFIPVGPISIKDSTSMEEFVSDERVEIPPRSFILGETVEFIDLPPDIRGILWPKSTYLRAGITLKTSPLEPGWKGIITLEIVNDSPFPGYVYPGEGIGQIVMEKIMPTKGYEGPYQNQKRVTRSRIGY